MRSIFVFLACFPIVAGCAAGEPRLDAGPDAALPGLDAGPIGRDAGAGDDDAATPGTDAGSTDGGANDAGGGGTDAGAPMDAGGADAGPDDPDAGDPDAGPVLCPGISTGDTVALDGAGDLAAYPSEQLLAPGATYDAGDQAAITWDARYLYVTVVSNGFTDASRPLHVYLEAASGALGAATPGTGKEYDVLTPVFDFTPTHLIAVRRTSDLGGTDYNGLYTPASDWTDRPVTFTSGDDYWVGSGDRAISVRVPWTDLGCPTAIRLSAHVVEAEAFNEWKITLPATATPWDDDTTGAGAFYEIDLSEDPAVSGWSTI